MVVAASTAAVAEFADCIGTVAIEDMARGVHVHLPFGEGDMDSILRLGQKYPSAGLAVMVRVSARTHTAQEANQLGGAVILPLIFLAVGQSTGLLLVTLFLIELVAWGTFFNTFAHGGDLRPDLVVLRAM